MSDNAITVEGLSKQYKVAGQTPPPGTLYEMLSEMMKSPWSRARALAGHTPASDIFWSLRDVSFKVNHGEVIGVIGRNGAGKSTLLKILSRITAPTEGRVTVRGRMASLLEVGTGFHPELTGRENIYLNGAILGMLKADITRQFDAIVGFAEVERFVDTPVKRYSSGMYVRLAFSVAAHLDPDILVIDEVLAVGDAAFQRRCLGKMHDVASAGRTVIFVSHNMGAVTQLCSRALLLEEGRCTFQGKTQDVITRYIGSMDATHAHATFVRAADKPVQLTSVAVCASDGNPTLAVTHSSPFSIRTEYHVAAWPAGSYVCVEILNEQDLRIVWSCDATSVEEVSAIRSPGQYCAWATVPANVLTPGRYYFTVAIYSPGYGTIHDLKERVVSIEVTDGGSLLSAIGIANPAVTCVPLDWHTEVTGAGK